MNRPMFSRVLLGAIQRMAMASALAVVVPCRPAVAQQHEKSQSQHTPARGEVRLQDRDRELMHPGDPLRIVPPEATGHEFRAETPALTQTDRRVTTLDPEEMHRRAIALYERGKLLAEPTSGAPDPVALDRAPTRSEGAGKPEGGVAPAAEPQGPRLEWVLGGAALGLVLLRLRKVLVRAFSAPVPAVDPNLPIRVSARPRKRQGPSPDDVKAPLPSRTQLRHQERTTAS